MRAVDCPCGEPFEARNDSDLLEAVQRHATREHEGQYSDAELRVLVNTNAYDVGPAGGHGVGARDRSREPLLCNQLAAKSPP